MASAQPPMGTGPLGSGTYFYPRLPHPPQGFPGTRPVMPVYMHPYLPYQLPIPMSLPYNPHFGLPPVGFGPAVLPMVPNPYVQAPGFVLQSSPLPLTDFSQLMEPALGMGLHSQQFRLSNPPSRIVVSSGVQTETLSSNRRLTTLESRSDSGRETNGNTSTPLTTPGSTPTSSVHLQPDNQAILGSLGDVRRGCKAPLSKGASQHVPLAGLSAQSGSPGGAQLDHPTDGAIDRPSVDNSSHCADEGMEVQQVPDLLVGEGFQSSGSEGTLSRERERTLEPKLDAAPVNRSSVWERPDVLEDKGAGNTEGSFKIVKLPFDGQFVAAWRGLAEESVWSVESLAPFVPPAEWLARHGVVSHENGTDSMRTTTRASNPEDDISLPGFRKEADASGKGWRLLDSPAPGVSAVSCLTDVRHVHCCARLMPCVGECWLSSRGLLEREAMESSRSPSS